MMLHLIAMNEISPPPDEPVADAPDQPSPAKKPRRRSRIADVDMSARSYDVDTLLVELGPGADGENGPADGICRTVEDLYAADARFRIQQDFADFLEPAGLTATELLHRADIQDSFTQWAQHDAALDRLAATQAAPGRWTAAMRSEELRTLEGQARQLTQAQGHRGAPPGINARRLSLHVNQSNAGLPPFRARFAIDASLSAWLSTAGNYAEKLGLLLALDSDELSDEAAAVVDQIVGEILASRGGLLTVLDGIAGLQRRLQALGELWRGELPSDDGASSLLRRLSSFSTRLRGGRLRLGVEQAIYRLLAGEERLRPPANPFEARKLGAVADEMQAAAAVLAGLACFGGTIGGEQTKFLLDQRLSRLVSGDNLEHMLRGKSHPARINDLLTLEAAAVGEQCRQALVEQIAGHFEVRDFTQRVFEMSRTPMARLKVLTELHHGLAQSGVPEPIKSRNLRMLDEVQYTFMRTNRILARIGGDGPAVADVLEHIGFLADKLFIEGKSAGAVRGLIGQHLRATPFVRAFVGETPKPGEARAERYARFFAQARAGGLDVRAPADARVLLADDEPQAREYVAMILGDLGVRQVTQVPDGRAAMDAFAADPDHFDLIVCDWRMPHLSGLEVLKQVRAARPALPFLMVTALSTLIAVEEAMAHDVTAYVAKPFTPEQLEEKIVLLLNRPMPVSASTSAPVPASTSAPVPAP